MLSLEKKNHRKKQQETMKKKKTLTTTAHLVPKVVFFFFFKTDLGEYFSEVEEPISEHDIQFYLKSNVI